VNLLVTLTLDGCVHRAAVDGCVHKGAVASIPQALKNWSLAAAVTTGITVAGSGSMVGIGSTEDATVSGAETLYVAGVDKATEGNAVVTVPKRAADFTGRLRHMTIWTSAGSIVGNDGDLYWQTAVDLRSS